MGAAGGGGFVGLAPTAVRAAKNGTDMAKFGSNQNGYLSYLFAERMDGLLGFVVVYLLSPSRNPQTWLVGYLAILAI